ncbi:hypothetical protein [Pleomorphomonas oryzae]|uniref:hypothetical protein n=1 Tax=Pleomorphomonas oryzae TaxID=261934 RepID=UPI0012EB4BD9|nr:hypothetical protein [Pleomorphomonas oryzae]
MPHDPPRPLPSPMADAGRSVIVVIRPSVLRLGLGARLVGAACLVLGIWIVIGWGLR